MLVDPPVFDLEHRSEPRPSPGTPEPVATGPAEALIAVAKEQHADLLVLGSSGTGRASWLLPGNVPNKVFQHAPCSILIARTD